MRRTGLTISRLAFGLAPLLLVACSASKSDDAQTSMPVEAPTVPPATATSVVATTARSRTTRRVFTTTTTEPEHVTAQRIAYLSEAIGCGTVLAVTTSGSDNRHSVSRCIISGSNDNATMVSIGSAVGLDAYLTISERAAVDEGVGMVSDGATWVVLTRNTSAIAALEALPGARVYTTP